MNRTLRDRFLKGNVLVITSAFLAYIVRMALLKTCEGSCSEIAALPASRLSFDIAAVVVALQYFYHRYPDLVGTWPDLSGYTSDDLDEMDAYIRTLHLTYYVSDRTKDVPDNDDAA